MVSVEQQLVRVAWNGVWNGVEASSRTVHRSAGPLTVARLRTPASDVTHDRRRHDNHDYANDDADAHRTHCVCIMQ